MKITISSTVNVSNVLVEMLQFIARKSPHYLYSRKSESLQKWRAGRKLSRKHTRLVESKFGDLYYVGNSGKCKLTGQGKRLLKLASQ